MNKSAFALTIVALITIISLASIIVTVKAQADYSIEQVYHKVQVLYNGYVLINDTMQLSFTGQPPTDFMIGFPDKYGSHVVEGFALSDTGVFQVTLNVPMSTPPKAGFYGAKVTFPDGAPENFSVIFLLANDLLVQSTQNASQFTLDFPAFPSLAGVAKSCNTSISLPLGATYLGGTVDSFRYVKDNLESFTSDPATINFLLDESSLKLIDFATVDRQISVNEFGEMLGTDTYEVANKANLELGSVQVFLPPNVSNPAAMDQFGRVLGQPFQTDSDTNRYYVNFSLPVQSGHSASFVLKYNLPASYLVQENNDFALHLSSFQYVNYYINQTSVTFLLPEGARILGFTSSSAGDIESISQSVFQQSFTMSKIGVISLDNFSVSITYSYNPLWLSFRPAMWVWTLAILGSVIVAVASRKPREASSKLAKPAIATGIRPESLKSFVDAYEEKKRILAEMDSIENRVQKGKIPRRRYKVRKRTLELRLNVLNRDLTEFKESMRAVGGKYSELMLQLEIAESEISEVAANIRNAEASHNRGELSLEAYRKRLDDYESRKEKAETNIEGILLRLREEIP